MLRNIIIGLVILISGVMVVSAQEGADTVTDDEVNEVASRMYCPICEMEPLHTCRATTCIEWRAEIREQLAEGRTEDEIVNYFVDFYGDRVVGVPEDDGLRLLSFAGPIAMTILAVFVGLWTFNRWQQRNAEIAPMTETSAGGFQPDAETDAYRNRLENDLRS